MNTDRLVHGGGFTTNRGRYESVEIMNHRGKEGKCHLITVWYTKEGEPTAQQTANWIVARLSNVDTENELRKEVERLEDVVSELENENGQLTEREDAFLGELLDLQHGRNKLEGEGDTE